MTNLIILIVMLLAGAGGWYAGSWSGRDAKEALALAQKAGVEAKTVRETIQTDLNRKIEVLTSEHDAAVRQIQTKFDGETANWQSLLAARDGKISALNQVASGARSQVALLNDRLAKAADPKERAALAQEINALKAQAVKAEVESAGNVCSMQRVPDEMLASLRGATP